MKLETLVRRAGATVTAMLVTVGVGGAALRAASQQSQTLIYATYDGQNTAGQVYKTIQSAQSSTGERIQAYAIVSKDVKGKVTVRDQRKRDGGVGAVLGGIIGLIGGPMGVTAGATAGGAVGYLTGDAVGIPRDKVESMKASLTPNTSALIVVLDDVWVQSVERDMSQADTRAVIASQIANPNGSANPGK